MKTTIIVKISFTFLIIFFTIIFSACQSSETKTLSANDSTVSKKDDWTLLFDGKTTTGWHTYGKDSIGKAWKIEDSTLHLDASQKDGWQTKDGGDIVTNDEFENFDLQLDWKISEAGNSGIMFYVDEDTSKYKYAWESGPEMQVADNDKNEDGKIEKSRAGDLYELFATTSQQYVKPAGQWNHIEIVSNKGKLDFYMNGEHVLDTVIRNSAWDKLIAATKFKDMPGFGTYKKGKIALQDHGADVWFKNIRIKEL